MYVKAVSFYMACALWSSSSASLISDSHFFSLLNEHENVIAMSCILKVMKREIPCSTVVTLVYSNDDLNYFVETINNSECYTVIIRSFNDQNWLIKTSAYVIVTENVKELAHGMSLITIDSFWNPRARIIVHTHYITYDEINDVFEIFMKYRCYDVVFITNKEEGDKGEVFTYFPFENGSCGKHFEDAEFIAYCDDFTDVQDFFPNKYHGRMKNCTITVLVNNDMPNIIIKRKENRTRVSGIEKYLLKSAADMEGLQINYIISSRESTLGVVLPNHTAIGSLAALQNNEADIAAGGYVLIQNRADVFDYIYGFNFASYKLYTASLDDPVWKTLSEEFDELTWGLLAITFCLVVIVSIIVLKPQKFVDDYSDLILKLWGFFFIGNSSGKLLKKGKLRILLVFWIWFTFFMSSFYNTALYSLITAYVEPAHHIGPDNLDSLPLKPCVSNHIRELFQFAYNHTLPDNVPLHECCHTEGALETVAARADLYAIEMTYSYKIMEYKFIDDEGNRRLDSWTFSTDNILTIHMARGFPLRDRFQNISLLLYEGGFLEYQADVFLRKSSHAAMMKPKIFRNISLSDLKYYYLVLLTGSLVSTLCLFVEICIHSRKSKFIES